MAATELNVGARKQGRRRMTALHDYNAAVDFVDRNVADGRGRKTACIDPARNLTYSELRDEAARIGPLLARLGVEREQRIALVLLDTVDFPVLFWGAIRAGIIPVLLNTRLTADQYRYLLEDSRAKAVFVSTALLPVVKEAAKDLPTLKSIIVVGGGPDSMPRLNVLLAAENEAAAPAHTCADEVAYWIYSSGTTGNPKGVMHVHSAPMTMARAAGQDRIGIREDDLVFSAAKLFFSYGLGNAIFCPMSVGATSVFIPSGRHLRPYSKRCAAISRPCSTAFPPCMRPCSLIRSANRRTGRVDYAYVSRRVSRCRRMLARHGGSASDWTSSTASDRPKWVTSISPTFRAPWNTAQPACR